MVTEQKIRDRFVKCLGEVSRAETKKVIAEKIGCAPYYLSYLHKAPNPQIPAAVIANFCLTYGYSVTYILTGKGDMKTGTRAITKEEKWQIERDNLHELIARLIKANIQPDAIKELKKQFSSSKS